MIKLIINPDLNPQSHIFHKDVVVIGSGLSHAIDLALSDDKLKEIHVSIVKREMHFFAINNANDPFVTLNGAPFGKKKLTQDDVLQVGQSTLCIQTHLHNELPANHTTLASRLSEKQKTSPKNFPLDVAKFVKQAKALEFPQPQPKAVEPSAEIIAQKVSEEEESPLQLEPKKSLNIHNIGQKTATPSKNEKKPIATLKDYYLSEFDDETESWNANKHNKQSTTTPQKHNLKWFLCLAFLILLSVALIAGVSYLSIKGKSEKEELLAAEGVADVTMALTYAQIHHIKPQKQNWSDPDFLKNSLNAVLGFKYPPFVTIDAHGQFDTSPYILRIYTSSDQSQFLIIAQPAPSLLQWLIPKAAIMVDSKTMEMRKTKDLKTLNRLLVNPNMLDGSNALEISHIVSQGELIPLTALGGKKDKREFFPPKALALIRPGAENYIYNAPRYYHFGEGFIKQSLEISQKEASSHEVIRLQQEIEGLTHYQDMILYTSRGIQSATEAQKALATFAPQGQFLIAYLKFNAKGKVTSSHLIMDDSSSKIASSGKDFSEEISFEDNSIKTPSAKPPSENSEVSFSEKSETFSQNHPLFLQLSSVANARTIALEAVGNEVNALLSLNEKGLLLNYQKELQPLLAKYEQLNLEHRLKIIKSLSFLYSEYSSMPLTQFNSYVESTGLENFLEEYIQTLKEKIGPISLQSSDVEMLLNKVQDAKSIEELANQTAQAASIIKLERLPDLKLVQRYQNTLHISVLKKLNQLLFSPNPKNAAKDFQRQNSTFLEHIMQSAWIVNPEEYEFYMNEFYLLTESVAGSQ